MKPKETIERFDLFLHDRRQAFEAVLVGGAALSLLGVIDRQTRDCDVLHPPIPDPIVKTAAEFAAEARARGMPLQDDWLNQNPAQLADVLPEGWLARTMTVFEGRALKLFVLGRSDLLLSKLFALCDRGTDLADCLALSPTSEELHRAAAWLERQDTNPQWPAHIHECLADLGRRLGHGL
ncbi:MAG: hypothetical protein FJ098_03595 [Deltaproteobacteria bacterium]|nr:hypothetical protein [Deltaproteobacteria bacterium]